MEFLKELFEAGALTWEQFSTAVSEKGYKLADLSTGNYVGKKKHDDEIATKTTAINDLQNQLKTRDTDIQQLQDQLTSAGDDATKIADLTTQLEKLQGDYTNAQKDYNARLGKQRYEFAVKEYANSQKFTSNAAKRDFINEMLSENLKMKNDTIVGADDFMSEYAKVNSDAFVIEEPEPAPAPEPKPIFVTPQQQQQNVSNNPFENAFHFSGVREKQ